MSHLKGNGRNMGVEIMKNRTEGIFALVAWFTDLEIKGKKNTAIRARGVYCSDAGYG